jgi:hypothetical protein
MNNSSLKPPFKNREGKSEPSLDFCVDQFVSLLVQVVLEKKRVGSRKGEVCGK